MATMVVLRETSSVRATKKARRGGRTTSTRSTKRRRAERRSSRRVRPVEVAATRRRPTEERSASLRAGGERARTVVPQRDLGVRPNSSFGEELLHDDMILLHLPRLNDRLVPEYEDGFSADGRNELPHLSYDVDFDDPRGFLDGRIFVWDVGDGEFDAEEGTAGAASKEGEFRRIDGRGNEEGVAEVDELGGLEERGLDDAGRLGEAGWGAAVEVLRCASSVRWRRSLGWENGPRLWSNGLIHPRRRSQTRPLFRAWRWWWRLHPATLLAFGERLSIAVHAGGEPSVRPE